MSKLTWSMLTDDAPLAPYILIRAETSSGGDLALVTHLGADGFGGAPWASASQKRLDRNDPS